MSQTFKWTTFGVCPVRSQEVGGLYLLVTGAAAGEATTQGWSELRLRLKAAGEGRAQVGAE